MSHLLIGRLNRIGKGQTILSSYDICASEELLIGRDRTSCHVHLEAPWISNRHLRIYSIIYDPKTEPFVYAEDLSSNGNNSWLYMRDEYWESCHMHRGTTILLSDGNRLRLCDGTTFTYHSEWISPKPQIPQEVDELRELERESFRNSYHMSDRKLGEGGYATVFMAVDRFTERQVACKIVKLKRVATHHCSSHYFGSTGNTSHAKIRPLLPKQPKPETLWREVELLKGISHPNVVQLHRVLYTKSTLYLVEDLITGGDLASYLAQEGGCLEEEDACNKVFQILKALEFLHETGIVHRDIKPDNVLLSVPSAKARVVLTDFGGAVGGLTTTARRLNSLCGTAGYVAPEVSGDNSKVNRTGYTNAVDLWSVGCLTTSLFLGQSYFAPSLSLSSQDTRRSSMIIRAAAAGCDLSKIDYAPEWNGVEDRVKWFIKSLLCLDETKRPTAKEALCSPWFSAGYRKSSSHRFYDNLVKDWKPVRPAADYSEDLRAYIKFSIPEEDARRRLLSSNQTRIRNETISSLSLKRRRSSFSDTEDAAIRNAAWEENRGLISAKAYAIKIHTLRQNKAQKKHLH